MEKKKSQAFDPDAFLMGTNKKKEFDPEEFLREGLPMEGKTNAPPPTSASPVSQAKQREISEKIQRGMLPQKTMGQMALESLGESNTAAAQALMDQTFFGLPGKAARALGVYGNQVPPVDGGRGKYRRPEDWIPDEQQLAGVPSAAIDMAAMGGPLSKAGEVIGQAPQIIARKLGMSEAKTAVRAPIQTLENAVASGGLYGGISGAAHNESLSDLPRDIGSGIIEGAAGNALMSSVPVGFSALKNAGEAAITRRAVKPLVGIGQGVKADKALAGLGRGDVELGEQEMKRVIQDEGLAPIVNSKSTKMQKKFDAKLEEVWAKELGPIRARALSVEPDAKIPVKKIEDALRGLVSKEQQGTDVHDDVEKAIELIKDRAGKIGNKTSFPVTNLLKNAQEFERDGFGKSVPKFADGATARAIGKTLRGLTDDRIASIYAKNPQVVREMLGIPEKSEVPRLLETGELNPDYVEATKPRAKVVAKKKPALPWQQGSEEENLNLDILGSRYRAGLKRYADLKKLEPLIEQLAKRRAEHRPGLISTIKHGTGSLAAGALGFGAAGQHGVIPAMAAAEGLRLSKPFIDRATAAVGRFGSGNPVDPVLSGAIIGGKGEPE